MFIKQVPIHSYFFFNFFLLLLVLVVVVILLLLLLLLLAVSFYMVASHLFPAFIDLPFLILSLLTCFVELFSMI